MPSDNDGYVKVSIEVNRFGGKHGRTVTHTEDYPGLKFEYVHEHVAYAIKGCVSAVFEESGENDLEAKLVYGHLKRDPMVKESVLVFEGEGPAPKGAMVVNHNGEVLNDEWEY